MRRFRFACLALVVAGCGAPTSDLKPVAGRSSIGRQVATVRTPATPGPAGDQSTAGPPEPLHDTEPVPRREEVRVARRAAQRFFRAYVRFLLGRIPAGQVSDAGPRLRAQLSQSRTLVTPAERASTLRIARLTVRPAGPPISAIATATLVAGPGRYSLTAILEPQHGRWTVVAVDR